MSIVIKVENVSKQYRLGTVGTGTLAHDLNRGWHRMRGKEDPYLKIGEANDRTSKADSDYIWALKDINFGVNKGDVLGIVGSNGAGKSTLLKILSKTTLPTAGTVKIKGRIASLLEVGTGFHPELSGRENIFLNGAILGMTRREIKAKFDEIVDFAGVDRYIDTPVKRYSSGMYVRLAFGVAAHLEPDILIVDEVLAVGDTEFQKKAMGKMRDVSNKDGRTVLFVSHNLSAIKSLCNKGILLENGMLSASDDIRKILERYFIDRTQKETARSLNAKFNDIAFFLDWTLINGIDTYSAYSRETCLISFDLKIIKEIKNSEFGLVIRDHQGEIIFGCNSRDNGGGLLEFHSGSYRICFSIRLPLRYGLYEMDIALVSEGILIDQFVPFNKLNIISQFDSVLNDKWIGILNEPIKFSHEKIN